MDKGSKEGRKIGSADNDNSLDQQYWEAKWIGNHLGWDIGHASSAITDYVADYPDKGAAILIPGCGNAHEASYLVSNGFDNITLLDISPTAVELLKERFIHLPQVHVLCRDFFQHQGQYDLIIEQTFFCALVPGNPCPWQKEELCGKGR